MYATSDGRTTDADHRIMPPSRGHNNVLLRILMLYYGILVYTVIIFCLCMLYCYFGYVWWENEI